MNLISKAKHHFSRQHFIAAQYFANRAFEIEQAEFPEQPLLNVHRAYVTGAIISVVASIESAINELYLTAVDGSLLFCDNTELGIKTDHKMNKLLSLWWEEGELDSKSIRLKYQNALLIMKEEKYKKGKQPFQDFINLIELRNALVHYKPEWQNEAKIHKKLKDRLGSKFPGNPFGKGSAIWFPHECLGSGCALWAVKTGEDFLKDFYNRTGISKNSWAISLEES
jgi:hypothetical protein